MKVEFSNVLRKYADKLWEKQLETDIIKGIGDGSLDIEKFKFYIKQDYLYLKVFDKVAALAITKTDDIEKMRQFCSVLEFTLTKEAEFRLDLGKEMGVSKEEFERTEMAPTSVAYTNFLLTAAYSGNYGEVLAAYSPCPWGYYEIFSRLKSNGMPTGKPLYVETIEFYTTPELKELVEWLQKELDEIGAQAREAEKEKLKQLFLIASRYEYLFWDACFKQEVWLDQKW